MKKTVISTIALAAVLAFAGAPAIAAGHNDSVVVIEGAGSWDYKGFEGHNVARGSNVKFDKVINSGGGDFMVDVTRNDGGGRLTIALFEKDGDTSHHVRSIDVTGTGNAVFTSIGGQVDGDNGMAEFFIKVYNNGPGGYVGVAYYD